MVSRAAIAALLPGTWYADAPLELRIEKMVEQWRKLHNCEQQFADALAALRAEMAELVRQENEEYTERSALDAGEWALESIDTAIAKLGLPAPTVKEKE